MLNALERLANGYSSECVRVRQDLAIAESQLRDYRERLGKPFPHDTYLSELVELRDQLKAGLSAAAHEAGDDKEPRVIELADRIKALKATNTIEATPQRGQRKHTAAEEPITARIRRRREANPASDQSVGQDASSGPADDQAPAEGENSPSKSPRNFQERIARERRQQDQGPSLP